MGGFGKIRFRDTADAGQEAYDALLDLPFNPKDSDTEILLENNTLTTIGVEVNNVANQKTRADAKVCYHDIERTPENDMEFSLINKFNVVARIKPKEEQGTCTSNNFAFFAPLKVWLATGGWFKVVWQVKWTTNGLMPVRPVVIVTMQVDVPAKQAVQF